jgi:DNA-binding IclR family transcriptional regulator
MNMRHRINLGNWKSIACTAALATGLVLFAGAPGARADECRERLVRADHRLHEAIEHHGWESRQAEHWRHELHEAREYCWAHAHRWWDEDGHRWHSDRDWDDHDHDRDHDRYR